MKGTFRLLVASLVLPGILVGVACSRRVDPWVCATGRDPAAAIKACTAAIESGRLNDDELAKAYLHRSAFHVALKDNDGAIADLDALVKRQPHNAVAIGNRGVVYAYKGDLDRAVADIEQSIRIDPKIDWNYVNLATAYGKKHDYARAVPLYGQAIALRPANGIAWGGRCWSRAVTGTDLDAAVEDCNRSLQLTGNDRGITANTLNSRGFVDFRKQQYRDAIRDDDAAIALDPSVASSYYIRGLAKLALGDATGRDDVARGRSLEPGIVQRFEGFGVPAPP